MALFKSGIIASASGSAGGYTFSHNRGGMYIRNRSIPTNPNSGFQQVIRAALVSLTSKWGEVLTEAQRDAWTVYADQVLIPNSFGDPRAISGIAHYVRCNVSRIQAGLTRVDNAPTIFNLGDVTQPTIAGLTPPAALTVAFDNTDDWANEDGGALLVYVAPPRPQSVNFFKGPYRYAGMIEGDGSIPPTSPAAITTPFAYSATTAQRCNVTIRCSRADGRLSGNFQDRLDIP